jgi:hypothetical protein
MELDVEPFQSEEGNIDLGTNVTIYNSSEHECSETDDEDFLSDYSDEDDINPGFCLCSRPRLYWDEWLHLPVGMYDPFDSSFPRNLSDIEWGIMATRFIYYNLQTYEDWGLMLDFICEPFSDWEGIYLRTRSWFNSLRFDIQMEIWVQRNLGLRPRSKWILGPHDELLEEWMTRYEMGRCRIVDVYFPGMELGYALTSGRSLTFQHTL